MDAHPLTIPADAVPPVRHPEAPAPGETIASHHRYCFGCGIEHPTGLHITITADAGLSVSARFLVTEHHQGAPGIAHGGLLASAFDEALGATNWLIRTSAVTAHLEISYRMPVPVGSVVHIVAGIDAVLRRKIWASAQGRLDAPDGPLAVTAASLYMQVPVEHFTRHGRAEDIAAAAEDPYVSAHLRGLDISP